MATCVELADQKAHLQAENTVLAAERDDYTAQAGAKQNQINQNNSAIAVINMQMSMQGCT